MHLRAAQPRVSERGADLRALDGLDRYQRSDQFGVQPAVEVDVAAQPRRCAQRHHLEHPAQRVLGLHRSRDSAVHGVCGGRVGAAHVVSLGQREAVPVRQIVRDVRVHIADAGDVAADGDAELGQVRLADCADRHAHGRLSRAGALQPRPQVAVAVLDRRGQVRVARPRDRHRWDLLFGPRPIVQVGHLQADRPAGGAAGSHAPGDADRVPLDPHASARAVGDLPPRQLPVDVFGRERQPGDHAFEDRGQLWTVALTRGKET